MPGLLSLDRRGSESILGLSEAGLACAMSIRGDKASGGSLTTAKLAAPGAAGAGVTGEAAHQEQEEGQGEPDAQRVAPCVASSMAVHVFLPFCCESSVDHRIVNRGDSHAAGPQAWESPLQEIGDLLRAGSGAVNLVVSVIGHCGTACAGRLMANTLPLFASVHSWPGGTNACTRVSACPPISTLKLWQEARCPAGPTPGQPGFCRP